MADLLEDLGERAKSLSAAGTGYAVLASALLYVAGYLALRFHLTVIGVGTDLTVLDERYLFTGARFLVYLVAAVPALLLLALPFLLLAAAGWRLLPRARRERVAAWRPNPRTLTIFGIVFAVVMIQFVMRQSFALSNLLLADRLPAAPSWLVALLLDEWLVPLYFSALVAGCALSLAVLVAARRAPVPAPLRGLLLFLAAVQILLLPVNYGVLVIDKSLPRVAALGADPLQDGDQAWLVWETDAGMTFLVRNQGQGRKSLVWLPRSEIRRTEIVAFDPIFTTLFERPDAGGAE